MGLLLFFLLIVLANFLGAKYGTLEIQEFSFTLGLFVTVPLFILRCYLQEAGKGLKPFLISIPAFVVCYFVNVAYVDNPGKRTAAVAIALCWALILDRIFFTYFRKFGWLGSMLLSNIISIPMLTIFFFYLYTDGFNVPDAQLLLKYLTLAVIYGILLITGFGDKHFEGPRFVRVQRKDWFRFYDRI